MIDKEIFGFPEHEKHKEGQKNAYERTVKRRSDEIGYSKG